MILFDENQFLQESPTLRNNTKIIRVEFNIYSWLYTIVALSNKHPKDPRDC